MREVKFKTSYTDELIFGTVQETADYIDIDGYSNARNIKEAYKQLGNSVSVPIIEKIMANMIKTYEKTLEK